jgi:hypothetical protein
METTGGFLNALNSDVARDSELLYKVEGLGRKCARRATAAASLRGERYNHYDIKRNIQAGSSNALSDVRDQRYGVKGRMQILNVAGTKQI